MMLLNLPSDWETKDWAESLSSTPDWEVEGIGSFGGESPTALSTVKLKEEEEEGTTLIVTFPWKDIKLSWPDRTEWGVLEQHGFQVWLHFEIC